MLTAASYTYTYADTIIESPIKSKSFQDLLYALAGYVREIGILLAVTALIWTGFKFVTGALGGDSKKLGEAKTMFWWVLVGTAIVVGATVIVQAVINTAGNL